MKKILIGLILSIVVVFSANCQDKKCVSFGLVRLEEKSINNYQSTTFEFTEQAQIKFDEVRKFIESKGYKYIGKDVGTDLIDGNTWEHNIYLFFNPLKTKGINLDFVHMHTVIRPNTYEPNGIISDRYYLKVRTNITKIAPQADI
ncbi:hypothetical protein ACXR6G_03525 [Ancylomarina sp. YFZ004]